MNSTNKIPVGILGATGSVGQKFIQLIENHPFFEIVQVMASDKSAGKKYKDAVSWFLPTPIPEKVSNLLVDNCVPDKKIRFVFSGLDASVAGDIETEFAEAGFTVVSNSKNHRFDKNVPLLIPEVNPDHLDLVTSQQHNGGMIITNPNCSTIGLTLALKPMEDAFGIEDINVVTMQALSGAGFPGVSSLSIMDNIVPYIGGEEEKIESEPLKICNRVPVIDGHLEVVQVNLKEKASKESLIETWRNFRGEPQVLKLPTAPEKPIHYFDDPLYPQPRLHRNLENGMAVSVGRLKECPIFDYRFVVLSHNTMRGAAGGALLCAELLIKKGYFSQNG
jgi:aspartate-semialdehyde dehydrogenase